MSAIGWVLIMSLFAWFIVAVAIGWMDASIRRRDRDNLELREWQEKVDAMRRLHDMEGDA